MVFRNLHTLYIRFARGRHLLINCLHLSRFSHQVYLFLPIYYLCDETKGEKAPTIEKLERKKSIFILDKDAFLLLALLQTRKFKVFNI